MTLGYHHDAGLEMAATSLAWEFRSHNTSRAVTALDSCPLPEARSQLQTPRVHRRSDVLGCQKGAQSAALALLTDDSPLGIRASINSSQSLPPKKLDIVSSPEFAKSECKMLPNQATQRCSVPNNIFKKSRDEISGVRGQREKRPRASYEVEDGDGWADEHLLRRATWCDEADWPDARRTSGRTAKGGTHTHTHAHTRSKGRCGLDNG